MIRIKRIYEAAEQSDGARVLVDRVWPRGLRKETLQLESWNKEVAPSAQLRKWFGHDPSRWREFVGQYHEELNHNRESWQPILEAAKSGTVTLLFGARDLDHNNAVALKEFLEEQGDGIASKRKTGNPTSRDRKPATGKTPTRRSVRRRS